MSRTKFPSRGENHVSWKGGQFKDSSGRVQVWTLDGYVYRYRLVIEEHLGRKLSRREIVHHINEIIDDDRIENLQVMSISEHMKLHNSGEKHPMYGKPRTEETKARLSESKKGKKINISDEARELMRNSGERNGMFGRKHSEETRKKMAEKAKNRIITEETRKTLSEAQTRRWAKLRGSR